MLFYQSSSQSMHLLASIYEPNTGFANWYRSFCLGKVYTEQLVSQNSARNNVILSVIEPIDALKSVVLRIFGGLRWMKIQTLEGYLRRTLQISPCITWGEMFPCYYRNMSCQQFQSMQNVSIFSYYKL